MSEDAILYSMVREGFTANMTFETRFTKDRERILRISNNSVLGRGSSQQGLRLVGGSSFDMHKGQGGQARFARSEEEW